MSARASAMSRHTPVPTSITDWCISDLTFSFSTRLPWAISSVWMCERRSNVSGSTVWYSSSMPMVNEGFVDPPLSIGAQRSASGAGGSWAFFTAILATASTIQAKFSVPHRVGIGVGRRVHEVDGVGHAVLDRELHGVEVVAEGRHSVSESLLTRSMSAGG